MDYQYQQMPFFQENGGQGGMYFYDHSVRPGFRRPRPRPGFGFGGPGFGLGFLGGLTAGALLTPGPGFGYGYPYPSPYGYPVYPYGPYPYYY